MNVKLFEAMLRGSRDAWVRRERHDYHPEGDDAGIAAIRIRRDVRPPHNWPLRNQCMRFRAQFGDSRVEQREPWRLA